MIQRIQSIFLLLAILSGLACFFAPFWVFTGSGYTCNVNLYEVNKIMDTSSFQVISTIPLIVILSIMVLLGLVSLFYYKNRQMQIKINGFNLLFTVIFIGTLYLWIPYIVTDKLPDAVYEWQFGLIFPLISLLCISLANRFIRKDERLVKSADRLR